MKTPRPANISLFAIVILMLLYQFVCLPGIKKTRDLNRLLQQKRKDLSTLNSLISQYREKTTTQVPSLAPENFNLYLFVSKSSELIDSKSKISRITPVIENVLSNTVEQHVSLTIEEIELEKLLMFLEEIEKRDFLRYGYLQISRNPQKQFVLKAEIDLVCYKAKKE